MVDALQDHHEVGLVSWRCHCILSEESGLSECALRVCFFVVIGVRNGTAKLCEHNGTNRHPYIVMMPTQSFDSTPTLYFCDSNPTSSKD